MLGPFSLTHEGVPGLRTPGQKPRVMPAKASVVSRALYFPITAYVGATPAPQETPDTAAGPVRLPQVTDFTGGLPGNGSFQIPESAPLALYPNQKFNVRLKPSLGARTTV